MPFITLTITQKQQTKGKVEQQQRGKINGVKIASGHNAIKAFNSQHGLQAFPLKCSTYSFASNKNLEIFAGSSAELYGNGPFRMDEVNFKIEQ